MHHKTKMIKILMIFTVFLLFYSPGLSNVHAAEEPTKRELKILVIEINPYLETKGKNVSDFLNTFGSDQNIQKSINEVKEDFEYASNGLVTCNIVAQEYLNEFPKYTKQFTLSSIDSTTGKRVVQFPKDR